MSKTYIVTVSGGKDSTATLLHLKYDLDLPVEAVFSDTGHEAIVTYWYLIYLSHEVHPITRIQGNMQQLRKDLDPEEPLTMLSLCRHKQRFPGMMSRFCTTELKLKPLREHVRARQEEEPDTEFVLVNGVRADESPKRAAMDERGFDEFMGVERWLPILHWTAAEVFACHDRHNVLANPLYTQGMGRVGCFPCIYARKNELKNIAVRYPDAFERLGKMEADVARHSKRGISSFFPADKCAQTYRSQVDPKTGTRFAAAEDVRRWATNELARGGLFDEFDLDKTDDLAGPSCLSQYGLCE